MRGLDVLHLLSMALAYALFAGWIDLWPTVGAAVAGFVVAWCRQLRGDDVWRSARLLETLEVHSITFPGGLTVQTPTERPAQTLAWKMYIELSTRVTGATLEGGTLKAAFKSLYELFQTTRQALIEAGPDAGVATGSVGSLAISVLNEHLRPFLSKWHPQLDALHRGGAAGDEAEREAAWENTAAVRAELETLRGNLEMTREGLRQLARR
jgi:hypothetical protein